MVHTSWEKSLRMREYSHDDDDDVCARSNFFSFLFIIKKAQNINECPSYIKTNSMFQLKLSFSIPWKITSIINFVGLCLFLASGACILRDWSDIKTRGYWPPNTTRYTQLMLVKCLLHAI